MSKNETVTATNPLADFQKSQPSVKAIQNPPAPKPFLADENPLSPSLESLRCVGNFFVWRDSNLNESGRYMECLNAFQKFAGDTKYLSANNDPAKEKPTEMLALSFVSFKESMAVDGVTPIVEKIPFRDGNIAGGVQFVPAKEFLEAAEISHEANQLSREAEDHLRAQMRGQRR